MGRRSAIDPVVLHAKLPIGEAAIWELIKQFDAKGEPWSAAMIDAETNRSKNSVSNYVYRLRKAGIAKVVRSEPRGGRRDPTPLFRLARVPALAPRLSHTGKQAPPRVVDLLWPAMRTLKQFTLRELTFAAQVEKGKPISNSTAWNYVKALTVAGYIVQLPRAYQRATATYRLRPNMNTGPRAPHMLAVRGIWDPNTKTLIGNADAKEVA